MKPTAAGGSTPRRRAAGLPLAWLVVFFLLPVALVAGYSVDVLSLYPGRALVTLAGWHDFFHGPVYLKLFWKSIKLSLIVSVVVVAARLPGRVLPGDERDEAEVHAAAGADRAVPDELPAARARVEGDPRQQRRAEQLPLLDGPALARSPDLAAPVQQVRGDAGARLHLGAVRRAADLRLARVPRPAAARGGERSRAPPVAGVPAGDAAAEPARASSRRSCSCSSRRSASSSRLRWSAERRGYLYGNQIVDLFGTGLPGLADGLGALALPAVRRRGADARLLAVPPDRGRWPRADGRRALPERGAAPAGVLRPRRRVPLRADPAAAHLLVQRLAICRRSR